MNLIIAHPPSTPNATYPVGCMYCIIYSQDYVFIQCSVPLFPRTKETKRTATTRTLGDYPVYTNTTRWTQQPLNIIQGRATSRQLLIQTDSQNTRGLQRVYPANNWTSVTLPFLRTTGVRQKTTERRGGDFLPRETDPHAFHTVILPFIKLWEESNTFITRTLLHLSPLPAILTSYTLYISRTSST